MRSTSLIRIAAHAYEVPMRTAFSHASFSHFVAKGVLIQVAFNSLCGWGEAAPRAYVTGEDAHSVGKDCACLDIDRLATDLDLDDFAGAVAVISALRSYFPADMVVGNCTMAALELALLDTLLKHQHKTFSDLFRYVIEHPHRADDQRELAYTWVLDLNNARLFPQQMASQRWLVPRKLKIKANQDLAQLCAALESIRQMMPAHVQIVLDANGGWTTEQFFEAGRLLQPFGIACIEEPVNARNWPVMATFRQRFKMPLMLDESATDEHDLIAANRESAFDIVNVRLSKCGGFIKSLRMIKSIRQMGKQVYLGVHVGEVGPLWATQRMLAACMPDAFGVEVGKQDEWFTESTTTPPYLVDRTRHTARAFHGPGHGVEPARHVLDFMTPLCTLTTHRTA